MKVNSAKFDRIVDILFDVAEMSVMLQRHACALIMGGKIRAISENTDGKPFANHSEMNAISNYLAKNKPNTLTRCTLVIIRINRQGEICDSKPCSECIKYLKHYHIKKIFYSGKNGFEFTNSDNIENGHQTLYFRRAAILNSN
jgi:tRNA(Arg) A34 adenosine deaminase TadA